MPGRPAFVDRVLLERDGADVERYPFSIPAIRTLDTLELHPEATFLVGENGSGKSTLIEAIAVAFGFNAEGGTRNFDFATKATESSLHQHVRLSRTARQAQDGFFFRAESFYSLDGEAGIEAVDYEETDHFQLTRDFLNGRESFFRHLFD